MNFMPFAKLGPTICVFSTIVGGIVGRPAFALAEQDCTRILPYMYEVRTVEIDDTVIDSYRNSLCSKYVRNISNSSRGAGGASLKVFDLFGLSGSGGGSASYSDDELMHMCFSSSLAKDDRHKLKETISTFHKEVVDAWKVCMDGGKGPRLASIQGPDPSKVTVVLNYLPYFREDNTE